MKSSAEKCLALREASESFTYRTEALARRSWINAARPRRAVRYFWRLRHVLGERKAEAEQQPRHEVVPRDEKRVNRKGRTAPPRSPYCNVQMLGVGARFECPGVRLADENIAHCRPGRWSLPAGPMESIGRTQIVARLPQCRIAHRAENLMRITWIATTSPVVRVSSKPIPTI